MLNPSWSFSNKEMCFFSFSCLSFFLSLRLLPISLMTLPNKVPWLISAHLSTLTEVKLSSSPYTTQQHNTATFVSSDHSCWQSLLRTKGMSFIWNIEPFVGVQPGKYLSSNFKQLTKGRSLSIPGCKGQICGMIGPQPMHLGCEGCMSGNFKHQFQSQFLILRQLCGIFLYLQFQTQNSSPPLIFYNISKSSILCSTVSHKLSLSLDQCSKQLQKILLMILELSIQILLLFPSVLLSKGLIIDLYSLFPSDMLSLFLPQNESPLDDNFYEPYQSVRQIMKMFFMFRQYEYISFLYYSYCQWRLLSMCFIQSMGSMRQMGHCCLCLDYLTAASF